MKVLVAVKRVLDYSSQKVPVEYNSDQNQGQGSGAGRGKNVDKPFLWDRHAVGRHSQRKEKGEFNYGPVYWPSRVRNMPLREEKVLWNPLALGADKAIYVHTTLRHDTELQPLIVAKTLLYFINRDKYDLVLLGKQCTVYFRFQLLMMTSTRRASCWPDCCSGPRRPSLRRSSPRKGLSKWPEKWTPGSRPSK